MIQPAKGYCFVIEDVRGGAQTASGIHLIEQTQRSHCITGVVHEVLDEESSLKLKKGDRVIYSQLCAEQLDLSDEQGNSIKNLRVLHCDSIHGKLI